MNLIDISWPISENITEYKNKKSIKIIQTSKYKKDGVREKLITFNSHTGTHIDAPSHFTENGKTLDQLTLNKFYGLCKIFDLTNVKEKITSKNLENLDIQKNDIVILKTTNSNLQEEGDFVSDYVYLEKSGAKYLADKKIKTFGFDYLGIESNQPNHETHKYLLENEIPIIEGLRLKNVKQGKYILSCFPIYINNADGAPARAILIEK
ncbi:cyclase family protein [Candidatus Dependentiae bacterium]|nr:cyclase family protein [Candidatus Dependentiae bacterium]